MSSRRFRAAVSGGCSLLVSLTILAGCATSDASTPIAGAELFESCVACHGDQGQGNQELGAPRIAGLPQWYLTGQVEKFQTGLRGEHPDDYEGLRMRAMARQMLDEAEVTAVSEHVAGLPAVVNPATMTSDDPAAAETLYTTLCVACHGVNGEGNETLGAPPIAGLDDWYMARQIEKFRSGVRGTAPGDTFGVQMRGMSLQVQPEMIDDIVTFARNLPGAGN